MGQHLRTGVRLSSSPPQKRDVSFRTSLFYVQFLCCFMLTILITILFYFILFYFSISLLILFLFFSYIRDAKKNPLTMPFLRLQNAILWDADTITTR